MFIILHDQVMFCSITTGCHYINHNRVIYKKNIGMLNKTCYFSIQIIIHPCKRVCRMLDRELS